jgi:hypothetical protein
MGLAKQRMMEEQNGHFEGSDGSVAISGGFLDIQVDGSTICTVSIPIPNFMADRYRDSVSQWSEEFEDFDGNNYIATVWSSMNGVDWEVDVTPKENGLTSLDEILHDISEKIQITTNYTEEV